MFDFNLEDKLVSIIVPVYNAQNSLNKCIESVLNQTYKKIELILVDDGSTDNSLHLCLEYASKNKQIKVISQTNSGVASARNRGINESIGEFITFLDSDDCFAIDYVEKLCNKAVNYDMVIGNYVNVYQNNLMVKNETIMCDNKVYCWPIVNNLNISCWRCLFRREIINKYNIRFTENCRTGEDLEFSFKYMINSRNINYDNDALYYYYINPLSVMHQRDKRHFDSIDAMQRVIEWLNVYCLNENKKTIFNRIKYFYIFRMLEFAIYQVLSGGEKPKHVLKFLEVKKYKKLIDECFEESICYNSIHLKEWKKSNIKCLRKLYFKILYHNIKNKIKKKVSKV